MGGALSIGLWAVAGPLQAPEPAGLVGQWRGSGRLYEVKLQAACGRLPVDLRIEPGGRLSGTLGAARVLPSEPMARKGRIDYEARLDGQPCAALAAEKSHLVLLITVARAEGWQGDFHLKSRFGFDPGMHAGEIEVRRVD